MPQLHNGVLAVSYEELIPTFYSSTGYLKRYLSMCHERGFGLRRLIRAHKGGQALIEFDSLPTHIREALYDPRKDRHILESFFMVDSEAVEFFQFFRFNDSTTISDGKNGKSRDLQALYIANASVLKAILKLKEARIYEMTTKGHRPKKIWESLCQDMISFKLILKQKYALQCELPETAQRFKSCVLNFEQNGYACLVSRRHRNSNTRKVKKSVLGVLESLFAMQAYKPTYTDVFSAYRGFLNGSVEVLNNETGEVYHPKSFPSLSRSTVQNYLSSWQSRIGTHGYRCGNRQRFIGQYKTPHSLKKSEYAGSLISIDDRQAPFEYAKGLRPWLYVGIDDGSECYISWVYNKKKDGEMMVNFYRQLARNCHEWNVGIPLELEAESSLNSSLKEGLLRPGNMFEYVRIEANNARGKIIERYNQYFRYGDEKKMPGWIARPFAQAEANQIGLSSVPLIPYENIISNVLHEIQRWNNMPHSKYLEKTRWEIFLERQHPNIKPINWRGILPYIGYKTNTTCKLGQVRLQNNDYLLGDNSEIHLGKTLIDLMKQIEGCEVEAYWLDDNEGTVIKGYVYLGGKYICELLRKPSYQRARAEQTDKDIEARKIMSSYVATIEAYAKRKKHAIEAITIIDNREFTLNNKFVIRELEDSISFESENKFRRSLKDVF